MKRLLLTGVSGFLGQTVAGLAVEEYRVSGTYHSNSIDLQGVETFPLSLDEPREIAAAFERTRPDLVIHTAALSQPEACEKEPGLSLQINLAATQEIARRCAESGAKLLFCSTDLVFDGKRGNYSETDETAPLMTYGRHKVAAEEAVLGISSDFLVCRLPLMYGESSTPNGSFLQGFIKRLDETGRLQLFTDEYRSPADSRSVARALLEFGETQCGILHLGGPQRLSRHEWGQIMAEAYDIPMDRIGKALQSEVTFAAPRAADTSLNSEKAFSLGYRPADHLTVLKTIAQNSTS